MGNPCKNAIPDWEPVSSSQNIKWVTEFYKNLCGVKQTEVNCNECSACIKNKNMSSTGDLIEIIKTCSNNDLSTGAIIGITIGVLVAIALIAVLIFFVIKKKKMKK